jgi:putative oxidoreductase
MDVQLLVTEAVSNAPIKLDDLGTQDVPIERVRTRKIGDRDHDVIDAHARTIRAPGIGHPGRSVPVLMSLTSVITTDLALGLVRVVVGLVIAAHGAQKVLGVWGGPGLGGWTQGMTRMGMRPPAFWAWLSAFAELAGGLAFAVGFLLPVVAAALTIQMGVAIARAHWGKGFWNSKGGIEFPLTLGAVAAVNGIADPGAYSLDHLLGVPPLGVAVFFGVLIVGTLAYLVGARTAGAQPAKAGPPA